MVLRCGDSSQGLVSILVVITITIVVAFAWLVPRFAAFSVSETSLVGAAVFIILELLIFVLVLQAVFPALLEKFVAEKGAVIIVHVVVITIMVLVDSAVAVLVAVLRAIRI